MMKSSLASKVNMTRQMSRSKGWSHHILWHSSEKLDDDFLVINCLTPELPDVDSVPRSRWPVEGCRPECAVQRVRNCTISLLRWLAASRIFRNPRLKKPERRRLREEKLKYVVVVKWYIEIVSADAHFNTRILTSMGQSLWDDIKIPGPQWDTWYQISSQKGHPAFNFSLFCC